MTRRSWIAVGVLSFLGAACGTGQAEDATASVAEAVEPASNATDSPEIGRLLEGAVGAPDRDAAEGFRCDPSPEITTTTVCGKEFPASIHLAWTSCTIGPGAPPPGADGGTPPPPPPGGDHHGGMGGPGHDDGTSSGTVDVTLTVTLDPTTECGDGAKFILSETTTFQIQRTAPDGRIASASGTTTSTGELGPSGPETKETQLDVTRTFADASGTVRSVHLTGTTSVTFDRTVDPMVRTLSGTLTAAFSDGNTDTIVIADLVRPAPSVCRWPTSGTVTRTAADGTQHVLAYGPTCGQATLDGTDITLKGPPGGGGCGGTPPPGGDGGLLPPH